jgi:hypothetical protein
VLEYVEVYAGSDDGFEWWGGTVNSKYLVAAFIEDDDFDTDQGYRGTNQFWFGIKLKNGGVTSGGRGFEIDGDVNPGNGTAQPFSQWTAHNVTLIGRGKDVMTTAEGVAFFTEDGAAPNVYNSVFSDWNLGLQIQNDGLYHYTNTPVRAFIQNNVWDVNTNANPNGTFIFTTGGFNNTVEDAMLGGVSYTNDFGLDPRPQDGSPVYDNVLPGAPMPVAYRGAFSGPSDNWADGWSTLSSLGYLKPATAAPVSPELTIVDLGNGSVEISWPTQSGSNYQLQSKSPITGAWGNVGSVISGTGDVVTAPAQEISGDEQYFRVEVQ